MATRNSLVVGNTYEFEDSKYSLGEYLGKIVVQCGERNCKCHLSPSMEVFQFANGNYTETIFKMGLALKTDFVTQQSS